MHMQQRAVDPLDAAMVAGLNESEAAILTRVNEKRVQMAVSTEWSLGNSRDQLSVFMRRVMSVDYKQMPARQCRGTATPTSCSPASIAPTSDVD